LAVADAHSEDRLPAQARLRSLEDEELEQGAIVVDGVVLADGELAERPGAARQGAHLLALFTSFFLRGRRLPYVPRKILPRRDFRSPLPMNVPRLDGGPP